jgi:hypothetical protein
VQAMAMGAAYSEGSAPIAIVQPAQKGIFNGQSELKTG